MRVLISPVEVEAQKGLGVYPTSHNMGTNVHPMLVNATLSPQRTGWEIKVYNGTAAEESANLSPGHGL